MIADPYSIFAAAQAHWRAEVYAQHLTYGIAVTVSRNGVTSQAHYHAAYDVAENRITLNAVSDEEIAHPYTPHGIKFSINPFGGNVPLGAPEHTFDYLGLPDLAPNYAFGIVPSDAPPNTTRTDADIVAEIRREFHDPAPARRPQSDDGKLKTIAVVVVSHRQYDVRLLGTQPLDGHLDYHLALRPLSNPGMYRLREMWVDMATYATDRVVTDGNFTAPGLTGVRWQTDFAQISGATFISNEAALTGFTFDRRRYDTASVAFTDIVAAQNAAPYAELHQFATDADTAPPALIEPSKPPRF